MSLTFTLQGHSSVLSESYYPPIELDKDSEYCIGLIGLHTYNSIPNLEETNNKFIIQINQETRVLRIPLGVYEITDIETYLKNQLGDDIISLKPNNNTLKCEITCKYDIDFKSKGTIRKILGFSSEILKANTLHESNQPVNIRKVSSIRIECNIITGAFYDSNLSHTLYEFSPTVDPGYSIDIEPKNILYMKVNVHSIHDISLRIIDQDGDLVNFNKEKILIRLELKKHF